MTAEELIVRVDEAHLNGYIEADCNDCGNIITVEPDAYQAWCEVCGKDVKVNNFMIQHGLI